jgi:hypothetical protein
VYLCVLCLIVVPPPQGKPPFAVQLNNNSSRDFLRRDAVKFGTYVSIFPRTPPHLQSAGWIWQTLQKPSFYRYVRCQITGNGDLGTETNRTGRRTSAPSQIEPRTRSDLGQMSPKRTKDSVRVECWKLFLFEVNQLTGGCSIRLLDS